MREGKIRKIHQNTSAMLLTKTLGWGGGEMEVREISKQ